MRTIIGLIPKRSGQIEVMGVDIDGTHDRSTHNAAGRWGILFQQGALFSSLTALQNIQFPLRENLVAVRHADGRDRHRQARNGRADAGGRRQVSFRIVGRNDQARGAGARARARSRDRVSRRADLRAGPDRGGRIRRSDQDVAGNAWADGVHGHPRSRQPEYRLRPRRGTGGRQDRRHRLDARVASIRASLGAGPIFTASAP